MLREIAASFRFAKDSRVRTRIIIAYAFLLALNLVAWGVAILIYWPVWQYPAGLSLCFVAYGCGLRHAVDADHIAAIDNVTRKLMEQGQRPVGVGLFFSLGHSTVVVFLCLLIAIGTGFIKTHFPEFQEIGGAIGLTVSSAFLLLIALFNFVVFLRVWRGYRAVRAGQPLEEESLDGLLSGQGFLARIWRPLFRLVTKSWHMYPIGFLFGLGFDTASEIALLGIAATQASQAVPFGTIMLFPLLFTAGMCLIDTTDGVIMLGAYGWAFVKPRRKLFYNMAITFTSFLVAFLIGGFEALSLIAKRFDLDGGIWSAVNVFGENSGVVGYSVIGILLLCWLVSLIVYRKAEGDEP